MLTEDPLTSTTEEWRATAPLRPQELLLQPSEPDEYFNRNGTKSQLSLSSGPIFFYKTKEISKV
jgi:hypothetical protein